ncbi:MAG: hypothetical protein M3Y27_19630, partial [Acidobacteriota bacterium]|nr:hypothetical protein [Acidobacteriota bacterium]
MGLDREQLSLRFGFSFEDLYQREGLVKLDGRFLHALEATDAPLHQRLIAARAEPASLNDKQASELIIDVAPHLEDFVGELFGIQPEVHALQARHDKLAPL